jgi:hypothetical protein
LAEFERPRRGRVRSIPNQSCYPLNDANDARFARQKTWFTLMLDRCGIVGEKRSAFDSPSINSAIRISSLADLIVAGAERPKSAGKMRNW